jgi:hypothetical protein
MPVLSFYSDASRWCTMRFALGAQAISRAQEDRVEMFLELCRQRMHDANLDPVVARLSQALRVGEPDCDDIGWAFGAGCDSQLRVC